ncbi:hypothetical protein [Sulfuritalea hydrogenivorans]|nr:hypothetical protein [Sulfuritalea hydrogenivorans]
MEPLLFGSAATTTAAATTGLIGTAGAFSLAPALMTAGTVLSIGGQINQGQQQREMYNTQAQQSINDAAYRADAAKSQAEKIRKAGRAQVGEANASLAASGVRLGEGTPLEVQKTITQNSEEDALSAILSGQRATAAAQQEAQLLGKAGDNAVANSYTKAVGTVLQSGATVMGGWKRSGLARGYDGTYSASGPFNSRTYDKQIWD